MLDLENRQCSIYADRPLCCKVFPFDVLSIAGKLQWTVSHECPSDRKLFSATQGPGAKIGLATVSRLAEVLDGLLDTDMLQYLFRKERVAAMIELRNDGGNVWSPLMDCCGQRKLEAAGKDKKDKPKRKLKERKKKKEKHKKDKA
jgi:hypothetical protein